jgi:hypothetical protein
MANTGIELTEEILRQKYIYEELSISKISKELNYSPDTIHKRLKKYGLNRNKSQAQKLKCVKEGVHNKFSLNEKLLKKLYLEENLTTYEIANKLNCSKSKIYTTLKNMGINKSVSDVMKGKIPWNKNIPMSNETKNKIKESTKDRESYWLGKKRNDEDKTKMRLSAIKRVENKLIDNNQIFPNYNKYSIFYLEKYASENDYNIQHAENGGEFYIKDLGYWVDGYDLEKNAVIEFDEKHHNKKRQIIKDMYRQNQIINHLKCSFIRLDENGNEKLIINNHGE